MYSLKPTIRPRMLRAFNHSDYLLYWSGLAVSHVGTWVQSTAQDWLVLELTDDPFKLGLVLTLRFLPVLLFSLVAGVAVDRLPKRKLIMATQTLLLVQAVLLFALTALGVIRYEHIVILAVLQGFVQTVDNPARQAFVFELVGRDDLMNAISLNSAIFNVARMVGPALAGILIGFAGMPSTFFVNALSFLAVVAALFFIHPQCESESRPRQALRKEIAEGLAYIVRTPVLLSTLILLGFISMFALNFQVLVPVFSRNVLHAGVGGYGYLRAATGIGATLGAATLAALSRGEPKARLLFAGAMILSAFQMVMPMIRWYFPAFFLLLIMGWAMVTFSASTQTAIQVAVPNHLRGRVMSVHSLMMGGTTTLGSLFTGWTTDSFGASVAFGIAGALGLAASLAVGAWRLAIYRRGVDLAS